MRILALDASLSRCSVVLWQDGIVLASREAMGGRGQSALLAPMVAEVLQGQDYDLVAVGVGPGSFTGLRTAIALAEGLAAGKCPVVGVTVAEALADAVGPPGPRTLWVAIDSKRGRVFLDIAGNIRPLRRAKDELAPLAARPLYIDPPEASLPAGGLRPAPRA